MHDAPDALCVPYTRRPEWADIEPLPPPPGDAGKVVAISYDERHGEALSYFRAIVAKGELSARALELTRQLIGFNGADYTAWRWRWLCADALGGDLSEEIALTERVACEGAKNYQLWNHRRRIAAARGPAAAADELAFAARALGSDEKNYHAWAHRQAVVAAAGLWEEELRYSEAMVERDVRNNSAWAQRAFVKRTLLEQRQQQECCQVSRNGQQQQQQQQQQQAQEQQQKVQEQQQEASKVAASRSSSGSARSSGGGGDAEARLRAPFLDLLPGELEYTASQLAVAPRNESAWNYLLGLFSLPGATPHEMGRHKEVFIICREALADCPSCALALDCLAQYLFDMACLLRAAAEELVAAAAGAAGITSAVQGHQQPQQPSQQDQQHEQQEQQQQQGETEPGVRSIVSRARDAASKALQVLSKAAIADPIRRPYLAHREADVRALLSQLDALTP